MGAGATMAEKGNTTKVGRQQPGLACEACRARKLRCDREEPTCGTCKDLNITCVANTVRQPRGPKRGHIRALQTRIQALEQKLSENEGSVSNQEGGRDPSHQQISPSDQNQDSIMDMDQGYHSQKSSNASEKGDSSHSIWAWQQTFMSSNAEPLQSPSTTRLFDPYPNGADFSFWNTDINNLSSSVPSSTASEAGNLSRNGSADLSSLTSFLGSSATVPMTDLMKADLSDLFFERVHVFAPFLNKRRYFARAARSTGAVEPFTCLQHAMWTLAAAMSSQFQHIRNTFYTHTRSMLEMWELDILTENVPIEQAQAWILLAMYEVMQVNYQRGWISAGRCFRLVQLMKLHEIDNPKNAENIFNTCTWVEQEERRRTFWTAYQIDRHLNFLNQMPLSLNEQVILTRLPAHEVAFQRDQPAQTEFLSQLVGGKGSAAQLSSFTESIIFITISGRCLSHQQQCNVESVYGTLLENFIQRHQWLDSILAQKLAILASSTEAQGEPMQLFTEMAAHATTLLLCMAMSTVQWEMTKHQDIVTTCENRAIAAAQKIVTLFGKLSEYSFFKVHPFTPIPLYFCAEFARTRQTIDPRFTGLYTTMMDALRELCQHNKLAETCVLKLDPESILIEALRGNKLY